MTSPDDVRMGWRYLAVAAPLCLVGLAVGIVASGFLLPARHSLLGVILNIAGNLAFGYVNFKVCDHIAVLIGGTYMKRKASGPEGSEVRPRFGSIERENGDVVLLVFRPTDQPGEFIGLDAATEKEVTIYPGDQLRADVIGPGHSIKVGYDE